MIAGIRGIVSHFRKNAKETVSTSETIEPPEEKIDTSGVVIKNVVLDPETPSDKETDGEGDASPQTTRLTISSMGDCTLGTDENFDPERSLNAYYNSYGADYFFSHVRDILEADDLSIVNFEGTLTTASEREEKKFAFKGDPDYADILSGSSVETANIANNHSKDYGEESYTDTLSTLSQAGITTFGYEQAALIQIKGVKVGLTGIYELADHLERTEQVKQNIAALKEAGADLIIVNFHWGTEREYTPNDDQKTLAHLAIDEGADLVIGHHPHVLQGIEQYKGKSIAYSLGNFCFGGNSNPEDKDTMIFQQTFTIQDGKVLDDAKTNIIPCRLSSSTGHNDYCPTPLDGEEGQAVLDKIEEISAKL